MLTYKFALHILSPFPCLNFVWKEMRCYNFFKIKHTSLYCALLFLSLVLMELQFLYSVFESLYSLPEFSPMLDGISEVVLKAYRRFYYSYLNYQQQQDAVKSTDCETFAATLL